MTLKQKDKILITTWTHTIMIELSRFHIFINFQDQTIDCATSHVETVTQPEDNLCFRLHSTGLVITCVMLVLLDSS